MTKDSGAIQITPISSAHMTVLMQNSKQSRWKNRATQTKRRNASLRKMWMCFLPSRLRCAG